MDNCETTTKKMLGLLNVRHTNRYIADNILSHPDYPSLLTISDTLTKYNIENIAIKVDLNKLMDLPMPCIVQISKKGGAMFQILDSISEENVSYYIDKGKLIHISKEGFLKNWTGICLLAETSEDSKEPGIEKNWLSKRLMDFLKVSIIALFLIWTISTFISATKFWDTTSTFYVIVYTILKLGGVVFGTLLLWFEVDQNNPRIQSFCWGGGKINCGSVLSSKYANSLNGRISLSLLGFSYFFGSLGFLIVNGFNEAYLFLLAYLSLATLPLILLSVYYQAIVIKQWCKFSILIQGVLLLEILTTVLGGFYRGSVTPEMLPLFFFLFLLPILGWKLIKPLLETEKETNLYKRNLKKLKNNSNVFEGHLVKSRKLAQSSENLGIIFNNKNAKFNVIKVCNPIVGHAPKRIQF